jgi:hypothetical protein
VEVCARLNDWPMVIKKRNVSLGVGARCHSSEESGLKLIDQVDRLATCWLCLANVALVDEIFCLMAVALDM